MKLSILTWFTFLVLALVMGLNNIYSTLLTGWGEGGSIVAVILCLIFLPKHDRNILNYNLGQTMASAGGSVGFTVAIIAAIYYLYSTQNITWTPPLLDLSLFVAAISLMAVTIAIPFRPIIVKWFFPGAVACATILRTVTSDVRSERDHAKKVMGISGGIAALLTIPTKIAFSPGSPPLWSHLSLFSGITISLDPLLYGIGIVIGHRIGISMLFGACFKLFVIDHIFSDNPAMMEESSRWIAVGMMTLPAFTSAIFALLLKNYRDLPPGFVPNQPSAEDKFTYKQWIMIGTVFVISLGVACLKAESLFDVAWYYLFAAVLISGPLCFALGKVSSETGINPVRLLSITLLFAFSIFERHSPGALLAIGIMGAAFASIAVDLFIDLRTGYLINAKPKHQIFMQYLGVVPVAFATVYFLQILAEDFGFGEGKYFPAPGAVVWATMAKAFSGGIKHIPHTVWMAFGVTSIIGVILSFFENWYLTKRIAISPFAVGIAMLLPFEMSTAICIGSICSLIPLYLVKNEGVERELKVREDLFKAGSAMFAASSLAGILAVILISLGVVSLPG